MKKLLLLSILCATNMFAQNITFSDANLKAALLDHVPLLDRNQDGEISVDEAEMVETIFIADRGVTSFPEISNFTNLEELFASDNNLTSLDVSMLPNLKLLYAYSNPNLASLSLYSGGVAAYENINLNACALTELVIPDNSIPMNHVQFASNNIASVTLGSIPYIEVLTFAGNELTNFDTGGLQGFQTIGLCCNLLENVSVCSAINADSNSNLAINDQNNTSTTRQYTLDPSLGITVTENQTWTEISCTPSPIIVFNDPSLKSALLSHDPVVDVNGDNEISEVEASSVHSLDFGNFKSTPIVSFDEIDYFMNLISLNINGNDLSTIDVSSLMSLENLSVANNTSLTEVILKSSGIYNTIDISNCSLTSFDLGNIERFNTLLLVGNNLESISLCGVQSAPNGANVDLSDQNNTSTTREYLLDPSLDITVTENQGWNEVDCRSLSTLENSLDNVVAYPNPVKDLLFIDGLREETKISIYTVSGQVVKIQTISSGVSNPINVSSFTKGIYLMTIESGKSSKTMKIIKN